MLFKYSEPIILIKFVDCNYINQSVSACVLVYTHTAVRSACICMWVAFWEASESLDFADQWLPVDWRLSALQRPPSPSTLPIMSSSRERRSHADVSVHSPFLFIFKTRTNLLHTAPMQTCPRAHWVSWWIQQWSYGSEWKSSYYNVRQTNEDNRDSQDKKKKRKEDLRETRGSTR